MSEQAEARQAEVLWAPSVSAQRETAMYKFAVSLGESVGETFADYEALHRYSVEHSETFWRYLFEYADINARGDVEPVRIGEGMPGTVFFPAVRMNFAENLLRYATRTPNAPALVSVSESRPRDVLSFSELHEEVRRVAAGLQSRGVETGDRVVGVLPNGIEAVVAMLATSSLGALWSSCSPDFGAQGVIDRFGQIAPKLLFFANGYRYGAKTFNCTQKLMPILGAVQSIECVVWVNALPDLGDHKPSEAIHWADFGSASAAEEPLNFVELPFNHPLYIMYSSGTTGVPKCIVHGQGGTLLQHVKELQLHTDLKAGDNICYYTTCGWMMWNWLVSSLFVGATVTLYDGSPGMPDMAGLWRLAASEGLTHLGTSPKYIGACRTEGVSPKSLGLNLKRLRVVLSTGAPLLPEDFDWVYGEVKPDNDVQLSSISGGTDLISCFMLGVPTVPVRRGEIQALGLGMDVVAVDEEGKTLSNERGELACRTPFVSMPVFFWDDADGERYRAAYFDRLPNTWLHGDYIQITGTLGKAGGVVVHGRSDTTLNPGGVRIGTAEIYRLVETMDDVRDSIVVGVPRAGDVVVTLFVQLRAGVSLDATLERSIRDTIRAGSTPRHVPTHIYRVDDIPYTISGKKVELAVRQVLCGEQPKNTTVLKDPEVLEQFRRFRGSV